MVKAGAGIDGWRMAWGVFGTQGGSPSGFLPRTWAPPGQREDRRPHSAPRQRQRQRARPRHPVELLRVRAGGRLTPWPGGTPRHTTAKQTERPAGVRAAPSSPAVAPSRAPEPGMRTRRRFELLAYLRPAAAKDNAHALPPSRGFVPRPLAPRHSKGPRAAVVMWRTGPPCSPPSTPRQEPPAATKGRSQRPGNECETCRRRVPSHVYAGGGAQRKETCRGGGWEGAWRASALAPVGEAVSPRRWPCAPPLRLPAPPAACAGAAAAGEAGASAARTMIRMSRSRMPAWHEPRPGQSFCGVVRGFRRAPVHVFVRSREWGGGGSPPSRAYPPPCQSGEAGSLPSAPGA